MEEISRVRTMWSLNILLLLFVSSLEYAKAVNSRYDWDFLMYTQSWPAAVCRVWTESNPIHTCNLPQSPDAWSIHGIWPSVPGSMGPFFCNKTWLFDPKEVNPIESELEQSWVNIEKGTPIYDLWAHEWNKHGTCAAALEPLNSQIKYFSQGLKWLQQYTMTSILSASNIVPSDTKPYSKEQIHQAIKDKLGVDAEIFCKHDKGIQYLWEIRLCFSKALEPIDCQANDLTNRLYSSDVSFITNCNNNGVTYTESYKPPNKLLVQLYKLTTWMQWFTL